LRILNGVKIDFKNILIPCLLGVVDVYKDKRPTATAYKLKRLDQSKLFPYKSKEVISFPPISTKT